MNTYNENLRNSVVSTLNEQEVNVQKISSSRNASMISLYYSQSSRITAGEKVGEVLKDYNYQSTMHIEAVNNNNIAINVVDAAKQEKEYVEQAVSNVAVGASNLQIATNAIVKLSSDMGSILNIASAANFDSQIFDRATESQYWMKQTAYNAELASQFAMEASARTAAVSSGTVEAEATGTGVAMKSMLDVLTAEFKNTSKTMDADNEALAKTSNSEKKSEGLLKDVDAEYVATKDAYALSNDELNLNITVPENIPDEIIVDLAGTDIGTSIKISSVKLGNDVVPTITDRDFVIATVASPTVIKEPEKPAETEEGAEGAEAAAATGEGVLASYGIRNYLK